MEWKENIFKDQEFPRNFVGMDIDDLIEELGGVGRYQTFLIIFCCISNIMNGIMFQPLPYLYYMPDFECLVNGIYRPCD